jgi:3-methyladenine DNA glycosylase Tag
MKAHRAPWECTYAKEQKSKCLPGKQPKSDQVYFEILCLCILQAGLSWGIIRRNWKRYRKGFYNFNIDKVSRTKPSVLMKRDVIKNRKKIAAIIYNAKTFHEIKLEYGSFHDFLKTLNHMQKREVIRTLMKRFRHVGEYTAEFYPHCVGFK